MGVFSLGSASAAVISLTSGTGAIGGTDANVTMLVGPAVGPFAAAFTTTDFTNAVAGPAAFIVANHAAWTPTLTGYVGAQWVSTNALGSATLAINPAGANSALYAMSFNIVGPVTSAVLDLSFAVDNYLGSALNAGIFLNGNAIAGTTLVGAASATTSLLGTDVLSLLTTGVNTLYFNVTNQNANNNNVGPSGIMFGATLTTVSVTPTVAVPAPGVLALLALGLGMFFLMGLFGKRGSRINS